MCSKLALNIREFAEFEVPGDTGVFPAVQGTSSKALKPKSWSLRARWSPWTSRSTQGSAAPHAPPRHRPYDCSPQRSLLRPLALDWRIWAVDKESRPLYHTLEGSFSAASKPMFANISYTLVVLQDCSSSTRFTHFAPSDLLDALPLFKQYRKLLHLLVT